MEERAPLSSSSSQNSKLPLVVLVVGSAWLGHRSIIYTGTSWWNSSGPKAFAKQGCVTVCIRHRGSFPRIHGPLLLPLSCCIALAVAMLLFPHSGWQDDNGTIVASMVAVMVGWILLALGARGAADFDEMLADVSEALCWVQRHKDSDLLRQPSFSSTESFNDEKKEESNTKDTDKKSTTTLVFGGYSSGGHVAATLLQRPHLFRQKGLPEPHEFCDAALFISGVLAVRPPTTPVTTTTSSSTSESTWCTDLVTTVVFGKEGAAKLPSPLHGVENQPKVPHLLIGCRNEVFGLNWMDVFFCSRAFCDSLEQRKVPAKFVQVQSDHWNILGSKSLANALSTELEWIMTETSSGE